MNEFVQDTYNSVKSESSSPVQWSSPVNTDTLIICYLLVQSTAIVNMKYLTSGEPLLSSRLVILSLQGIMFLVYPLLCHLADVYLTKYCTLKCGIIAIVFSLLLVFALMLAHTLLRDVFHTQFPQNLWLTATIFPSAPIIGIISLGMFEANAILFGLNLLLEAPAPKLTFIHWYYWSQNVAGLVTFYMFEV